MLFTQAAVKYLLGFVSAFPWKFGRLCSQQQNILDFFEEKKHTAAYLTCFVRSVKYLLFQQLIGEAVPFFYYSLVYFFVLSLFIMSFFIYPYLFAYKYLQINTRINIQLISNVNEKPTHVLISLLSKTTD